MLLHYRRNGFAMSILLFLLLCVSCSPKISQLADYNRFVKNFNVHIVNDSLKIHLITPADITYSTTEKRIQEVMNKYKLKLNNEVLLVGTTTEPNYQFLLSIGDKKERKSDHKYVLDTLINGHQLHFIGYYQDQASAKSVAIDVKQVFNRILSGKNYLEEMSSVMDVVNKAMSNNQFLKTLTEVQQFKSSNPRGSLEMQMQLTYSSFLGNNDVYQQLIAAQEQSFKPKDSIVNVVKKNQLGNELALAEIVKLAAKTNMLMMNENHYYPNHRLLVLDLLPRLKEIGYTHLALEALAYPGDSLLNLPLAFPNLSTGFYTMEQHYGNLLREAKKLGFQFVAYENTDQKKDREIGQVENLFNNTIGKDPKAKVVVVAGIDHILEKPTPNGKKWMATLMKERYQIDPLTISQTHLNLYRSYSGFNYRLLAKEEFKGIKNIAAVDYFVLNNQSETPKLWTNTYRYQNKHQQAVQVNLFYEKEMKRDFDYQSNIPYFSTLLSPKAVALLPYNLNERALMVVYDQLGTVLEKRIIN